MIFYFSGSGNSLYAAKKISSAINEPIINIAEALQKNQTHYTIQKEEKVGFVFPVYAWGLPKPVIEFLNQVSFSFSQPFYTFAVATCGQNIGDTMSFFQKRLKRKKIQLNSGFSLPMPDNYVVLFDVVTKEKENEILKQADHLLQKIIKIILLKKENFFRVEKGKLPFLKSTIIYFLFHKFYTNTKRFYTTGECIGCGKCQTLCPCSMIHMKGQRPFWDSGNCYMCLSCLNHCPKGAIQYTKQTEKHGRYHNPRI